MKIRLTLEEIRGIIMSDFDDRKNIINVLYYKDKESLLKKIDIINYTVDASFKLATKVIDTGAIGITNDIKSTSSRFKKTINIICVPEGIIDTIESLLPKDIKRYYVVESSKNILETQTV